MLGKRKDKYEGDNHSQKMLTTLKKRRKQLENGLS